MKLTKSKTRPNKIERAVGYSIGYRGVESKELRELNAAIKQAQTLIMDIMSNVEGKNIKIESTNDIYKLSNSLSGLARARNEIERTTLEMSGLVALAGEKIIDEIRLGLIDHPEIWSQLEPIIEGAIINSDERARGHFDHERENSTEGQRQLPD